LMAPSNIIPGARSVLGGFALTGGEASA